MDCEKCKERDECNFYQNWLNTRGCCCKHKPVMDTKEAIEWLEEVGSGNVVALSKGNMPKVIELLQQGEEYKEYKKIYEDFCEYILKEENHDLIFVDNDGGVVVYEFEKIEKKYLGSTPKRPWEEASTLSGRFK